MKAYNTGREGQSVGRKGRRIDPVSLNPLFFCFDLLKNVFASENASNSLVATLGVIYSLRNLELSMNLATFVKIIKQNPLVIKTKNTLAFALLCARLSSVPRTF